MNASLHRAGLAVAALAVVATIGFAFVLDGYVAGARSASPTMPAAATDAAVSTPSPTAQSPETIYVRPAAAPSIIHVVQAARPAARPAPVVRAAATPSQEPETEDHHEGDDGHDGHDGHDGSGGDD